jgi:hypothetical protein
MKVPEMDTKPYLEYLDKEMTIMGILSAVSVLAPGGILSALVANVKDKGLALEIWNAGGLFIVGGSMLCIVAALFFYRQRSRLAWFYGQICLNETLAKGDLASRELILDADSWETWWSYSCGFTFLIAGFVEYLLAFATLLLPTFVQWPSVHLHAFEELFFSISLLVAALIAILQRYVLTRYKFSDHYWADFWSDLFKRTSQSERPHDGVYTRLKPSPLHGVGVFAIRDIPNGQYIFEPDDDETVSVLAEETEVLGPTLRQLYEDFCVLKGKSYECPSNFNKLTLSWYLNTSKDPNVAADLSLKFHAIRDIRAGEELTADYSAYSENESNDELSN